MKIDIKGYDIIREISRGPISTAYLGKQLSLNRPVLIKRLNNQWMNETDLMERFRREALICARLKHRNVVDIIDVETHPDNLYLVIEFIDGMDLARFIKEFSPMPFSVILYISREVLNGLAYAHRQGVIHRDIKPSNIMIGRDGIVKIADFGLARTADLPTISAHGEVVGTPAYMSPEQARISNLDERTDIFSLGITFYELAGQPSPFKGQSIVESIQKLLKDVPPPLHELNPEIPEWYSLLISKMLAKKTDDRPASAEAILENPHFLKTPSRSPELAQMIGQMNKESITFENTEISPPVIQSIDLPKSPGKRWLGIATTAVAVLLLGVWWINNKKKKK
ncbi:MAG: serine/threonine protein kinase, partial [Calditrichaeota bacterium]|nr:serine/threonine protein kinase [Calditrichota bacterium]